MKTLANNINELAYMLSFFLGAVLIVLLCPLWFILIWWDKMKKK